jgi:hypothetical protein
MAATLVVRQKQHAVVEFLCCENETVENIHKRLRNVMCMEMMLLIAVQLVGGHAD